MLVTEPAAPTTEEIIRAHQDGVWRFLVSIGCDAALADDITQDAFLAMLRGGFRYEGPRETTAWLLRVAKHQFIDHARRRKAVLGIDLANAETRWQAFEDDCAYEQRVQWLRECMENLPERAREAVRQRYELSLPREEMAKRLGVAPDGVKTLLARIRQKLRDCVQGKANDERA
jgi:RNA polymerase sigma-70 factor (ECF subfamily)